MSGPNYYPISAEWDQIGPIYRNRWSKHIWWEALVNFRINKARSPGEAPMATIMRIPIEEKASWQRYKRPCQHDYSWRRNEPPELLRHEIWDFVVMEACHWMVDLHLYVARKYLPKRDWQIVSSDCHSTVWEPESMTIWDPTFMVCGIPAEEALELARLT